MHNKRARSTKTTTPRAQAMSQVGKKSIGSKIMSLLGYAVFLSLLLYLIMSLIPSEIDLAAVVTTLQKLTLQQNIVLLLSGSVIILAYGWTAATALPGISFRKATQASAVSQLTAVALPTPGDMLIRLNMYRSYGFTVNTSVMAVVVASIARYFTVVAVPLLGLASLVVSGQGNSSRVIWLLLGGGVFAVSLWIMKLILASDAIARSIGKKLEVSINWLRKLIKQKAVVSIADTVVKLGREARSVVFGHFWSIAVAHMAWGGSCFVVLLLAVRFCGIDASVMSAAYLLLITGVMLALNSLPLPGGGVGVTEALLLSTMEFPNVETANAFTAALILYRLYTWLWPFPIGAGAYLAWRHGTRKRNTQTPKTDL